VVSSSPLAASLISLLLRLLSDAQFRQCLGVALGEAGSMPQIGWDAAAVGTWLRTLLPHNPGVAAMFQRADMHGVELFMLTDADLSDLKLSPGDSRTLMEALQRAPFRGEKVYHLLQNINVEHIAHKIDGVYIAEVLGPMMRQVLVTQLGKALAVNMPVTATAAQTMAVNGAPTELAGGTSLNIRGSSSTTNDLPLDVTCAVGTSVSISSSDVAVR
jgi:hypothetical protein